MAKLSGFTKVGEVFYNGRVHSYFKKTLDNSNRTTYMLAANFGDRRFRYARAIKKQVLLNIGARI